MYIDTLQAFIIGWTSDFIPKMYYALQTNPNQTLEGYVQHSLSYFDVNDFLNDTKPDNLQVDVFGNVAHCR